MHSRLAQMISGSAMQWWSWGDSIPDTENQILIGVATWSVYDLRLLDALDEMSANSKDRIRILDMEKVPDFVWSLDLFNQVIPGIGKIYQTPVIGIWEEGALVEKGSGAAGRDLVVDRYDLNREQIVKIPPLRNSLKV